MNRSFGTRPLSIGILLAAFGCAIGCRNGDPARDRPKPIVLRVAAASDLRAALPALIEDFRDKSAVEVEPTFGASGQLAEQIRQGAPFDLFLSADRGYVDRLVEAGRLRNGSAREYATGPLVLVVRESVSREIRSIQDLTKPIVRKIAVANPRVAPYGRAAMQALEFAKIRDRVAAKIVEGESVRHALQFVESANADAAIVAIAIADIPGVRRIAIDPASHAPVVQSVGVVADTKNAEAAERFAGFLIGPEGQARLARFGFKPPPVRRRSSGRDADS